MNPSLLLLTLVAAGDPQVFAVETVRQARLESDNVRLNADGSAHVGEKPVAAGELVALRRPGFPPLRPHDRPNMLFGYGDRWPGRLLAIENDRAHFAADLGREVPLSVPLTAISAIWLTSRSSALPERLDSDVPRKQDVVRLTNGDVISGSLISVARDGPVRFEVGRNATEIARDRIDAIFFSTELARPVRTKSLAAQLVTRNGARIRLTKLMADGESVNGETLFGDPLNLPWADVVSLAIIGGPAQFLSDLKPLRYESKPFFGLNWPLVADRSVVRGDLRLGGGTFDKGLGLHSECRVSYAIPPRAVRFASWVGLDDVTGVHGAVTVQFLVDGRPVRNGTVDIAGGQAPREVAFNLPPDAKEWTIIVEFGPAGDVQDHVNLGDARFVVAP